MKRYRRTVLSCLVVGVVVLFWASSRAVHQARLNDTLILALQGDNFAKARAALDAGADGNACYRPSYSPLALKAYYRRLFFPHAGPLEDRGEPALFIYLSGPYLPAAGMANPPEVREHPDLVKALLDAGADIQAVSLNFKWTPLQMAASHRQHQTMRLLIARGAKLNKRDLAGQTALHEAAKSGDREAVQILLDAGADCNVEDYQHCLPLHYALNNDHDAVATLLLQHNADLNRPDGNGVSPFQLAVENNRPEMVQAMLFHHPDVNHRDNYGWTVLDSALAKEDSLPLETPERHSVHKILALLRQTGAKTGKELLAAPQ